MVCQLNLNTAAINKTPLKHLSQEYLLEKPVIIKEDDLIVNLTITNIVHRLTCNYSCESLLSCIRKNIKNSIFAYFGQGRHLLW